MMWHFMPTNTFEWPLFAAEIFTFLFIWCYMERKCFRLLRTGYQIKAKMKRILWMYMYIEVSEGEDANTGWTVNVVSKDRGVSCLTLFENGTTAEKSRAWAWAWIGWLNHFSCWETGVHFLAKPTKALEHGLKLQLFQVCSSQWNANIPCSDKCGCRHLIKWLSQMKKMNPSNKIKRDYH